MAVKHTIFALLIVSMLNLTIGVPLNRITKDAKSNEVGHENLKKASTVSSATFISNEPGKLETTKTEQKTKTSTTTKATTTTKSNRKPLEPIPLNVDDDDDFDFDDMQHASSNGAGGSNLISLFNLSGNLLPGLSGGAAIQNIFKYMVRDYTTMKPMSFVRRRSMVNNEIEIGLDDTNSSSGKPNEGKKRVNGVFKESNDDKKDRPTLGTGKEVGNSLVKDLPFRRPKFDGGNKNSSVVSKKLESQKLASNEEESASDEEESASDEEKSASDEEKSASNEEKSASEEEEKNSLSEESDENSNNAAEESIESEGNESASKQIDSETEESSESDSDEPPGGGDGEGGGVLGFLAQFSGGEDGQSDLGSLLGAISGVIVNLSSEGDENPGSVLASYLLTSLDTLTGGGANTRTQTGEQQQTTPPLWVFKMDVLRALLQFGTSLLGIASTGTYH
ncbi:hypothetical protein EVAR_20324_1 [Eumeta japonica]|uniref:Uncharacterized protein n=1 Tax=Eumeta variegata TaxID=151549 RepID=A0A4C1VTJ3_EUMVA|nr:hypothetical protein EVAR_20324_1 [Eumeta japonica]